MWLISKLFIYSLPKNPQDSIVSHNMILLKPFWSNVLFLYPLKTFGFLTFSEGIEMKHWAKMD